jgi:integrase
MKRNRRAGVEDRWHRTIRDEYGNTCSVPSASNGKGSRWRARYVDDHGREHAKGFSRKTDAQQWLDGQTAALVSGTHVAPRDSRVTVAQWCEQWIAGYAVHRKGTVKSARTHVNLITEHLGHLLLSEVKPSDVRAWIAKLQGEGRKPSYIHALHRRLSQILSDAVLDRLLGTNPCSRRTSPPMGNAKVYVATTQQVWALYDAMPDHLRVAVLLGAFAGLRISEAAALRVSDVDFMHGSVHPVRQWPDMPLKTAGSDSPIPIPRELALMLSASVRTYPGDLLVTDGTGKAAGPYRIERALRQAREAVEDLPEGFTFHDLRHYLASLLIASGADIKTVQARMRHASARTTLDTYAHMWPDADESTRTAIARVITARTADALRTDRPSWQQSSRSEG